MASPSLFRSPTRPNRYVCATCAFRASQAPIVRRSLHLRYLARKNEAQRQWDANAKKILSGEKKSMLTHLEERGLVHAITGNRDDVDLAMTKHRLGAYVGIDPTASSLHIGHLLPLMSLFWMYVHGYHTVSVLGGATAKIGDPTDRLTTREKQDSSIRTANMVAMHYQLKKLWVNAESYGRKYGFIPEMGVSKRELVNNSVWMNKLTLMEVLQILGPGIRLGPMLARETVKNKMAKGDGMSFAEFTYPLLQGWDWWHMYHTKGVQMQIGGTDQFGNITAGIDAVKYISKTHPDPVVREKIENHPEPFGFTVPLLTTSAGQKFGKSAGNAVWLDKEQTSTFDLYGFFMRTSDEDVGRYLKLFTFLPIESIDAVMKEHLEDPKQRKAQHLLAREFLELIHGAEEAKAAEVQHRLMFTNANAMPPPASYYASAANGPEGSLVPQQVVLNNAPKANVKLPLSLIQKRSVGRILYAAGLASSSSDGHRIASSKSAYIGGHPGGKKEPGPMGQGDLTFTSVKLWLPEETQNFLIDDKLLILRRGKHNVRIIEVVSDEEYAQLGLTYPGMRSNALQKKESDSDAPPVIGSDSLEQNVSDGKVKKEGRRTRVKRKALEAYERREAYKKNREEWKDNFLTREKGSEGGKEDASPQKETRRDPTDPTTEWKNPHYHPHMIVSKGQLKGGNQLPFYPKKIGEPIPRLQPIPPTPTPAIVQKSYERFTSAQPPKSKPSIPAEYVETAEYNPPQLKSLIDQKTRPWGPVSDLPVRQK